MSKSGALRNAGNVGFITLAILLLAVNATCSAALSKEAKSGASPRDAKTDQNEWKKVVEAAKKEGKVAIVGVPGEEWRRSLVDMFQQEYPEIKVEYSSTPGRTMLPRIRQERELGKKLWDLSTGGLGTTVQMKKEGFYSPLRPLLLPEIADGSKWIGGTNRLFIDIDKKYMLAYLLFSQASAYVNRDFIKESELKSSEQLLDPKFRGKIVIVNPTGSSSRQQLYHLAFMYGEDFLRNLLSKQEVVITDDNRQQVEWLVRGRYPIAIGFSLTLLIPFEKQGLGKNIAQLEDKVALTTAASGVICLFEGAPHPNAAKVYVNWLLSQKTQAMLTKNIGHNSRRIDVPPVEKAIDPEKFIEQDKYYRMQDEERNEKDAMYDPIIKDALKR